MKKFVVALLLLASSLAVFAKDDPTAVPKAKLLSLIDDFRHYEGFDVVKIGRMGTSALKLVSKLASSDLDEEDLKALEMLDGINSFAVVDYYESEPAIKERFTQKVCKLFSKCEPLFEASDAGDDVLMYGTIDEENSTISDFILFSPLNCSLLCIFGTISLEDAMQLAEE